MQVVDLTLPIQPHWRYGLEQFLPHSADKGDRTQHTRFTLQSHWYTHIDSPRHYVPDGPTLEQYPLDLLVGEALVLDVSDAADNEGITADRLKRAMGDNGKRDIVLVKSARGRRVDWTTTDFWDSSCYMTKDGAEWLGDLGPKVVGFDFPQDHDIRLIRTRGEDGLDMTTHDSLLIERGILMIEYMHNLWSLDRDIINFVGLPLNLQGSDGAPIRCIAVLD
ncbi:MAG: cyclase family protein [Planctomycetes bacterium]|nr:cyclase family protein [Planctomycetota bacterium]